MNYFAYAQTNLQFYNQLLADKTYSEADVCLLRRSYELAASAFASRYRGNGKPFICHLVGTASVLAKYQRPVDEVAAGLLHACYQQGRFLWGGIIPAKKGVSRTKRDLVQDTTNANIEHLVFAFHQFHWSEKNLGNFSEHLSSASDLAKSAFIMRLANEIDEYLDHGMSFCGKQELHYGESLVNILRLLGQRLDCLPMVGELVTLVGLHKHNDVPAVLVTSRKGSFDLDYPALSIKRGIKAFMHES